MRDRPHKVRQLSSRLLCLAMFVCPAMEAMACPVCTEQRLLQSYWHIKVFGVLLIAPVLVTFTRLHAVRVLYTFIPLVLVNIRLLRLEMWYSHPAANSDGVPVNLITVLLALTTLLAPVLICCLGKFAFYSKDGKRGFLLWQPFAYIAVVWLAGPFLMG